jgi:hypothetical protein
MDHEPSAQWRQRRPAREIRAVHDDQRITVYQYRCGWAKKEGQERVLALEIDRAGFD